MINFTTYREKNGMGEIIQSGNCLSSSIQDQRPLLTDEVIEGISDDSLHYIPDLNTPVITLKPQNTITINKTEVIANGVDKIILSNVLINSNISITGPILLSNITDGSAIELTFSTLGEYKIIIDLFPYLIYEQIINAI